mmetsp:Transcript_4851/g.12287  ORF Transcript_4851/g.12287 Transcript_4851/m.12287 type:complete len:202 (+) Transcript_4851:775-1380(+)
MHARRAHLGDVCRREGQRLADRAEASNRMDGRGDLGAAWLRVGGRGAFAAQLRRVLMARRVAAVEARPLLAALGQVVQREELERRAVQLLARRRPERLLVVVLVLGARAEHLLRLEHVAAGAVEQREVQLHRKVVVAHVERHVLRARHPAGQRAHIVPREAKAERERPQQPAEGAALQPPCLRRWVRSEPNDRAGGELLFC